ncbi:MAG: hypothetical protein ACRDVC_04930 [Acidimicrobiales bacterium]
MGTTIVLLIAVGAIAFVIYWSSHHGDRRRSKGTSLRREVRAHTTSRGQPKKSFATREDALSSAHSMSIRGGGSLSAYRCDTCGKWHLGH